MRTFLITSLYLLSWLPGLMAVSTVDNCKDVVVTAYKTRLVTVTAGITTTSSTSSTSSALSIKSSSSKANEACNLATTTKRMTVSVKSTVTRTSARKTSTKIKTTTVTTKPTAVSVKVVTATRTLEVTKTIKANVVTATKKKTTTSTAKKTATPTTTKTTTSTTSIKTLYSKTQVTQAAGDLADLIKKNYIKSSNKVLNSNCKEDDLLLVWGLSVAIQAFSEATSILKISSLKDTALLLGNYVSRYYNSNLHAYSASSNKDEDVYYDDNAQLVSAFVKAYEATGQESFINSAKDVTTNFLAKGWNSKYGGVTWHYKSPYIASISTLETGVASIRVYQHSKDSSHLELAEKCMAWIHQHMWDNSSNLIYDGMTAGDVSHMEFSYQVGTALTLSVYLYKETKNTIYRTYASKLADAAINESLRIYKSSAPKNYRYWIDGIDFTNLLFEGLADYINAGMGATAAHTTKFKQQAETFYNFAKGSDSYYLKSADPTANSESAVSNWNKFSGDNIKFGSGPSKCSGSSEYEHKLMQQSAALRIFGQIYRVTETL